MAINYTLFVLQMMCSIVLIAGIGSQIGYVESSISLFERHKTATIQCVLLGDKVELEFAFNSIKNED